MLHFHCLAAKQGHRSSKQVNFCLYFVFSWIQIRCSAGHRKTKRKLKCKIRILSECKRWSWHLSGVLCGWVFFFFFPSTVFISFSVLEGEKRGKGVFFWGGGRVQVITPQRGDIELAQTNSRNDPWWGNNETGSPRSRPVLSPDKRPVWTNLGLGLAPDTGPRSVWDARSPAASARLLKAEGF